MLSGNQQVINLHKKAGFSQEGCLRSASDPRGEDVHLGMLQEEWPASRERLKTRASRYLSIFPK